MKYECYKLFVKRKAWILILLFMLLRFGTAFLQPNYTADYRMELYRDAFFQHMDVLSGKLNDEKINYIEEQNRQINALIMQEPSVDAYISGEITEDEFNERCRNQNIGNQKKQEFAAINDMLQRVRENPERVYFMYTNGWSGLIGNEHPDYVLLILLVLLTVPMICNEYATEMYSVLKLTPNGGLRLYTAKTAAAVLTAIVSAVLMFAIEFIYYSVVLGLPGGEYPLQSLPCFADSSYQISIADAAGLTLFNHCIGAVFMTILLICISCLFRRALSAVFMGIACVGLPFLMFSQNTLKYLFPSPLAFLLSSGFIRKRFPLTPYAEEYAMISPSEYYQTIFISCCIMLVLFIIGMIAFSGKKLFSCNLKHLCFLPVISILFTGCNEQIPKPDFSDIVYDSWLYKAETPDYTIVNDEEYGASIQWRNSEETIPLIHDCFMDENRKNQLARFSYIDGDTVYYLNQYGNSHYEIKALDLTDFSECTVQKRYWSDNIAEMDMLFGLGYYLPKQAPQTEIVNSFLIHDNQLIVSKSNGLFWYDLNTDKETCIYDQQTRHFAVTCGSVYYTDVMQDMYRFDITQKQSVKLPIGKQERFYANADGLYFKDLLNGAYYYVSPDGTQKTPMPDFDENRFLKGE